MNMLTPHQYVDWDILYERVKYRHFEKAKPGTFVDPTGVIDEVYGRVGIVEENG